jgi:diketogulonate reductase-like aldo/keto reductase
MTELTIDSTIELNNGVMMPIIGLGTAALFGKPAYQSVVWGLELGYKMIDTASMYGNERNVGKAIQESGIPRDELFISTKVWETDQGYDNTMVALEKSLKKLKLSYIDLYLIHWPRSKLRNETWKALEKILKDGKARAIGVSNYALHHLNELFEIASVVPAINQVEFTPFLYQKELLEFCKNKKIVLEAYSSLTRGQKFDNSALKSISQKYDKTPAQILIRWGLQHGIIQIPRSQSKQHIHENMDVFDFNIDNKDLELLNNLNEGFRLTEDPNSIK